MSKGALVVPSEFADHFRQSPFEISGLLNWSPVMGWDIRTINEDLSPYDTIMLNFSSTESEYGSIARQINPEVILIGCFDYGMDVVGQYFVNLERIKVVMDRLDHIFSVNKNQVEWMKNIFPDRTIHYCPHPCDMQNVMRFRRKPEDRNMGVGAMLHQYDMQQLQSLEVLKAVERKMKKPIQKTLIGLKSRWMKDRGILVPSASIPIVGNDYSDQKMRGQPIDPLLPDIVERTPPGIGWDAVLPYCGVEMWYSLLSQFKVVLDLYTVSSIGRFGMDCAGVGVPLVASERQDSSHLLYPFTRINPYIPDEAVKFVCKLLSQDTAFYERVERTALKNLEHYSFARSKERMLRIFE